MTDKNNKDLHFRLMSFEYKIRDFFNPPINILKQLNIKQGYYVLDFGCGQGSYFFSTAAKNRFRFFPITWLWTVDKVRTRIIELNRDIFIPELN